MGKNREMLHIFFKVLRNKKEAIALITPNAYQQSIFNIDYETLKKLGYKNLIFDIDNTITAVNSLEVSPKTKELFTKLKQDFTICIVSNNKEKRVEPIRKELQTMALANASKPQKDAFTKALKLVKGTKKNTAIIGDQMLSDIVGGNRYGLYTILVEPYKNKYDLKTGVSRLLQNRIMKKKNTINRYSYY